MPRSPEQPFLFPPDANPEPHPPVHHTSDTGDYIPTMLFSPDEAGEKAEEITLTDMTVILAPPTKRDLKKRHTHWRCLVATERDDAVLYTLQTSRAGEEDLFRIRLKPGDRISAKGLQTGSAENRIHGETYQVVAVKITALTIDARAAALKPA
jgi:hypothetical protein